MMRRCHHRVRKSRCAGSAFCFTNALGARVAPFRARRSGGEPDAQSTMLKAYSNGRTLIFRSRDEGTHRVPKNRDAPEAHFALPTRSELAFHLRQLAGGAVLLGFENQTAARDAGFCFLKLRNIDYPNRETAFLQDRSCFGKGRRHDQRLAEQ